MGFTKQEKEIIVNALKRSLDDVQRVEKLLDGDFRIFAGEVKYEKVVNDIIKKLK